MTTNIPSQNTWNRLAKVSLVLGLLSLSQIFCSLYSQYVSYETAGGGSIVLSVLLLIFSSLLGFSALLTGIIAVIHYKKCNKVGKISAIAGLVMGSLTMIYSTYSSFTIW